MDFDGFVPRRAAGRVQSRPPEMRQASLFKNPVSLRRNSLRVARPAHAAHPDGEAGGAGETAPPEDDVAVAFTFDALGPGAVSVFVLVTESERCSREGPSDDKAAADAPPEAPDASERLLELRARGGGGPPEPVEVRRFPSGLGQSFETSALDLSPWQEEAYMYDLERPRDIPLCIQISADAQHGERSAVHYTYISLQKSPAESSPPSASASSRRRGWHAQVVAQKLQYGPQCFVLHDVFGVASKQPVEHDVESGNSDCVICLSEPRDTAVLPCRHMCFCSHCAGIVRLQCNKCPVCRQKVVSLLQFRKGTEERREVPAGGCAATATPSGSST
mmetsp:Transcript_64615/g.178639  ORF Transcript_64615/g.178639 Transcript_64615/m.178639 type:complete len:333 (-) Transcript_64615:170-1168(-)